MEKYRLPSPFHEFCEKRCGEKERGKSVFFHEGLWRLRAPTAWQSHRVLVPECLRAWLLTMHHSMPMAAHQGHKRVLDQLKSGFFWPNMSRDTVRWVAACTACKKRKTPRPLRH